MKTRRFACLLLGILWLLGVVVLSAYGAQRADTPAEPARASQPDLSITGAGANTMEVSQPDVEAGTETAAFRPRLPCHKCGPRVIINCSCCQSGK